MFKNPHPTRFNEKLWIYLSGLILISISGISIVSWLNESPLTLLHNDAPTMKVNTSIGVLGCGLGLLLYKHEYGRRSPSIYLGGFIVLLSSATLLEYIFDVDLSIDQIILTDSFSPIHPGRPSVATALSLLISGIALIVFSTTYRIRNILCDSLIFLGVTFPLLVFSTYLYNYKSLFSFSLINSMSLLTSSSLIIFFFALSLTRKNSTIYLLFTSSGIAARGLRRLSVPVITMPIFLGWLIQEMVNRSQIDAELGIAILAVSYSTTGLIAVLWNAKRESDWLARYTIEVKKMQRAKSQLSFALDTSMGAVFLFSKSSQVIASNEGASRIFGWSTEEMKEMKLDDFIPPRLRESHKNHIHTFHQSETTAQVNDNLLNMVGYHKEGVEFPILVSINKQKIEGEVVFGAVILDASGIANQIQDLKNRAETDFLTGMANRHGLDSYRLRFKNKKPPANATLLMVDIDHFKRINDTYGHDAGDKVLQEFSHRLEDILRFHDRMFRLGGEEFLVIAKRASPEDAYNLIP